MPHHTAFSKVEQFFALLGQSVRYIHWKSNVRLSKALAGKTDLDLLVAQADAPRFGQLIEDMGFKRLISPPAKQYPGLEDYLGFDPATGSQAHLHVHYRLVLGEKYVKNYRLPLERALLATARPHPEKGVMIPAPAWEFVIMVVRVLLKTSTRHFLRPLRGRSPFPDAIQSELDYLFSQTTPEEIQSALEATEEVIPKELILQFISAWKDNLLGPLRLFRLQRQLYQALTPYQRMPRRQALSQYLIRSLDKRWPWKRTDGKRLATGGLTIAFVGPDGAGKSTLVKETQGWLSWKLDVQTLYMGSKEPSRPAWLLSQLKQLVFLSHRACQKLFAREHSLTRLFERVDAFTQSLYYLALARDRYQRYLTGQQAVAQGGLILYDRYSLKVLHEAMDGPRIRQTFSPKGTLSWLQWLANLEEQFYNQIGWPDLLIALYVRPEVALTRKPDHNAAHVRAKCEALQALRDETNAVLSESAQSQLVWIDAEQPLQQVRQKVRQAIWEAL